MSCLIHGSGTRRVLGAAHAAIIARRSEQRTCEGSLTLAIVAPGAFYAVRIVTPANVSRSLQEKEPGMRPG